MNELCVVNDDTICINDRRPEDPATIEPPESQIPNHPQLAWDEGDTAAINYRKLGGVLAKTGDLYCRAGYEGGLLLVRPDRSTKAITSAGDLAPLIVDRVDLAIYRDGKRKGSKLPVADLNTMLRTEAFLCQFTVVDQITKVARYLPDFRLTEPGYNDGGPDHRYLFVGESPQVYDSMDRIDAFLDVMDFETDADRANAVAAAITVLFRNHWPGGKPIILTTASKSHAGKDTVIAFAAGETDQCSISYQGTDWALERSFVGALNQNSDTGLVVFENARLGRGCKTIASAFVERFATDPQPFLFSTGTGPATRRRNDIVLAISTNFGSVSEDILNRSLPIHLEPVGHVSKRESPIGNPKLEFLPQNREGIAAELRGMVERWREAGSPLDHEARHPFSEWAKVVGGILKVNGIRGFLENYSKRCVADDRVRAGIGILAGSMCDERWHRPEELAREVVKLGLVNPVVPEGDRENIESQTRGVGVNLSAHRDEEFLVDMGSEMLTVRLERKRKRFDRKNGQTRYRFVVVDRRPIPFDE